MDYYNQQQYIREKNERNMKTYKNLTDPIKELLASGKKTKKYNDESYDEKQQRREARNKAKDLERTTKSQYGQVSAGLAMDSYVKNNYNVKTVIIDSDFRNTSTSQVPYNFSVKLAESYKNVFAVRLIRTELYDTTNNTGFFVINQMRIPIQFYNISSAYLYLNGYTLSQTTNGLINQIFTRITPGLELYPSVSSDITVDPHVYFLNPIQPKLTQFNVKLMNSDGSLYELPNARIVLTLVIYSQKNV